MILSTVSCEPHTPPQIEVLASMGVDYVCVRPRNSSKFYFKRWSEPIAALRDAGIKVLLTWPFLAGFQLSTPIRTDDPRYCFHAHDGSTNTSQQIGQTLDGTLQQLSHWNDTVEEALIADLDQWFEYGPVIDGIHIGIGTSDFPYPTNWYTKGDEHRKGTNMYWSFDPAAQAKWAEFSHRAPMPTHPDPNGGPGMDRFYRWYQDGWITRLITLTDAVLEAGLKHVSTWWMPHTQFTRANMANGTAGSIEPLHRWYQHVVDAGASPLVMVAHLFGTDDLQPGWYTDGVESITRACAPPYEWDLIVGAEADSAAAADNIRHHGKIVAEMGASGLLCSDEHWLGKEQGTEVAQAIDAVRPLFGGSRP